MTVGIGIDHNQVVVTTFALSSFVIWLCVEKSFEEAARSVFCSVVVASTTQLDFLLTVFLCLLSIEEKEFCFVFVVITTSLLFFTYVL